jgi:hypothetical protein
MRAPNAARSSGVARAQIAGPNPGAPESVSDSVPCPPLPPGMTDADMHALHAQYLKAKEKVGEPAGPGSYGKLLKAINAQAAKIMEQYNARAVDFMIVVEANRVVVLAKPKP